ncbi:MAG: transposase IS4 family [Prolixibacteraceae bacterium]|nr:MAG: transposase IS4 family [Prolixibacteraceae bacterium]
MYASFLSLHQSSAMGYHYLCVTRSKLKDYRAAKEQGKPVVVTDKRNSPVELLLVEKEGIDDSLLYVRSKRKAQKELSMHENFTSHFETGLNQILEGIQKKGGTKVIEKVWERIGRLKEKYPGTHRFFDIQVEHDGKKATSMAWKKILPASRKEEGVYFLRTSEKDINEVTFWEIYNPIRYRLKAKGNHHNWVHIVRIMNTQKAVTVTMQNKNDRKIYIRKCSKPETKVREIYDALGYKYQPWIRKSLPVRQTGVLPEKQSRKTVDTDYMEITS